MVHRELTAADLGSAALLDLIRSDDPQGVLSIYVDMPADGADRRAEIEIHNQLAGLERRVGEDGPVPRADSLRSTLVRIAPALERLLDPRATGRGGAVFAALGGSEVTSLSTPLPLASRVVLDSRPFLLPLFELLDAGEPAGVVLVSARQAELLDWRLGKLRRLARVTLEPRDERGQRPGPVVTNPARAQQITPLREQRSHRDRDRQMRWIRQVAAEAFRHADDRGWERILVSGDTRLTRPLLDALPDRLRVSALLDARRLDESDQPALAAAVAERLGRDRSSRNADLSRRVRAAALGAQRGALGLSEVVAAMNDGRAEHVIYDSAVRYRGAIGADGSLLAPGQALGLGKEEPRLLGRIVERALHTGARMTPVDGSAADNLADAGGIAALLRW